jgi:hypothetical protein
MKIAIHYQTQYAYAEPVSFSLHLFRLFPKADRHLSIRKVNFQTNADAVVSYRRDLFDNEIASVFYPSQSAQLTAQLSLELEVEEREEGDPRSPAETVAMGRGACRDFAVLMAATLHGMGLAARVVSGYLCEFDETKKYAEGALHAWTETYLPGAGWIGFDPTNGILCNHNHIPTAVGLSAPDIAPILGRYFHKTHVPALMTASLQIHEIA